MSTNLSQRVLGYRWVIFWMMALAFVFVYFHRLCPAVVALDLQKDLQTTGGFMGLLASAYFYPYAIMQFPAGLLSDSLGPRKTVTFFLVFAGLGSIIFGMATGVELAVAARIMVGFGVSMVFIPAMKILSQWFRIREFAFMTAILNTMGGVGALTAATPLALMTGWLGWRVSFGIVGAGTLVIAVLVWELVRNRPQDLGWPTLAEIDHIGPGTSAAPLVIPIWEGARRVITEKYFWPVAVWFFCLVGVFFSFGGLWAGPFLMHTYGLTRIEAGNILTMIAVGLIVGSPLISLLSDKVFHSRKKVLMLFSAVLCVLLFILNIYPNDLSTASLYIGMLLFSISSSAIVVIGFTTTKELFPVEIAGTSVGTVNLFPFLGGAILQPVLGWILEAYPKASPGVYSLSGYKAILLVLLGASIVALGSTFLMKETFPEPLVTESGLEKA
ncbi:MAG: MFS transporter [Deltaproteobacteria bacterium]|nr:MFS transporter [Deltaproteobacteria bacterium]